MKIQRYMTKGIQENLPIELQFSLRATKKDIDYLQFYKLSTISKQCNTIQVIHHEAETPKHNAVFIKNKTSYILWKQHS